MEGEKEAPPGYEWVDVKSFENGKAVFKKELVKKVMVGAPTEMKDATDEIKQMVLDLKKNVEEKANKTFSTFEAVKYTTQVVAGVMYQIKVKVNDNEYIHIRVLKNLSSNGGKFELKKVDEKTFKLDDPFH